MPQENTQLRLAREFIEDTGVNLFLTGKAGTGKTTFLRNLCRESNKRIVVAAPTGIAAVNAGGVTLHSLLQLPFGAYIPGVTVPDRRHDRFSRAKLRLLRAMDLLVIDEVSMVRADLLDAVDATLRRHRDHDRPFGGVQLLLIGDLGQLAPVVTDDEARLLRDVYKSPYFFESKALQRAGYRIIELQKVYRQADPTFIGILNRIRSGRADTDVLDALNSRYMPGFKPPHDAGYIRLTTHNRLARAVNDRELAALAAPSRTFTARITGDFPGTAYPADAGLQLKTGAQVMFIKNDTEIPRRYYNGMIGRVIAMTDDTVRVRPADPELPVITVRAAQWSNNVYELNDASGQIEQKSVGTFSQIPLRTAWAITIHKSQGLTFDHAIIDASAAFAHGQTYVALSRCRTLGGIVLDHPLTMAAVIPDDTLDNYITASAALRPQAQDLAGARRAYTLTLLNEMFDFTPLAAALESAYRAVSDAFGRRQPEIVGQYRDASLSFPGEYQDVARRFAPQYTAMATDDAPALGARINAAAKYYASKLSVLRDILRHTAADRENTTAAHRLATALDEFNLHLTVKQAVMDAMSHMPFTADLYLRTKSDACNAALHPGQARRQRTPMTRTAATDRQQPHADGPEITNPELYQALLDWRRAESARTGKPAYVIFSNQTLRNIAAARPRTIGQLRDIPGIGPAKIAAYATPILAITAR